ncbi:hypothetical protein I4U23_009355 [Adineta vaga]|nr:hypothetical protein I4U23_009355 [Adineta vaga]
MSAIVSRWISTIGGSILLIVGTIGALLNISVFTHSSLQKCPYSWYLVVAAFFDLITLDHALLLRILADGFGIDPISSHTIYCQLRFYTGQIASFVPITLTCLATIDRWSSTSRSVRIRKWSSIRTARYSIIIIIVIWCILSIPNLLVYQVIDGICKQTSRMYNDYTAFFLNPILYGLLPVLVLASFGYATYVNIHEITTQRRRNYGEIEKQLTRAIILHCASFIVSQISFTLWNLYLTFTRNEQKSTARSELETLFTQLTRLLFYFNYVSTFYINLIASKHIRYVLKYNFCLLLGRRVPIVQNRIYPFTNTVLKSNNRIPVFILN